MRRVKFSTGRPHESCRISSAVCGICDCDERICAAAVDAPRGAFVLAGIAVQILGLGLTFRAHLTLDEER